MSYEIPAQNLLTINEMRHYLSTRTLPHDFDDRLQVLVDERELAESPNVHYRSDAEFGLSLLLNWDEVAAVLDDDLLPANFPERVAHTSHDTCKNCSGRRCMDCLLRYEHVQCVQDCPDCC